MGGSATLKAMFDEDQNLLELHDVPDVKTYKYRVMDLVKKVVGKSLILLLIHEKITSLTHLDSGIAVPLEVGEIWTRSLRNH